MAASLIAEHARLGSEYQVYARAVLERVSHEAYFEEIDVQQSAAMPKVLGLARAVAKA